MFAASPFPFCLFSQFLPGVFNCRLEHESFVPESFYLPNQFDVLFRKSSMPGTSYFNFLDVRQVSIAPVPQLVFGYAYLVGHLAGAVSDFCLVHGNVLLWILV
jgi:hypothetical protein